MLSIFMVLLLANDVKPVLYVLSSQLFFLLRHVFIDQLKWLLLISPPACGISPIWGLGVECYLLTEAMQATYKESRCIGVSKDYDTSYPLHNFPLLSYHSHQKLESCHCCSLVTASPVISLHTSLIKYDFRIL